MDFFILLLCFIVLYALTLGWEGLTFQIGRPLLPPGAQKYKSPGGSSLSFCFCPCHGVKDNEEHADGQLFVDIKAKVHTGPYVLTEFTTFL